jgi:hypothetical protein
MNQDINVWLRGGEYRVSNTITFTPDDSGEAFAWARHLL